MGKETVNKFARLAILLFGVRFILHILVIVFQKAVYGLLGTTYLGKEDIFVVPFFSIASIALITIVGIICMVVIINKNSEKEIFVPALILFIFFIANIIISHIAQTAEVVYLGSVKGPDYIEANSVLNQASSYFDIPINIGICLLSMAVFGMAIVGRQAREYVDAKKTMISCIKTGLILQGIAIVILAVVICAQKFLFKIRMGSYIDISGVFVIPVVEIGYSILTAIVLIVFLNRIKSEDSMMKIKSISIIMSVIVIVLGILYQIASVVEISIVQNINNSVINSDIRSLFISGYSTVRGMFSITGGVIRVMANWTIHITLGMAIINSIKTEFDTFLH